jgi:methyl-accepting chemotaxis protein
MISAGKDAVFTAASDAELDRLSAGWSVALGGMAAELNVVAGTTEDEFLVIGDRLQDFYQRGTGISGLASEMLGEVAGDQVAQAMVGLGGMLDEMGRYVDNARKEIEASSATLREILGLLDQVADPLSGFKKVNKVLRMLGISTKIESARLGQSAAGFDTLASDVGDLAVQVNDKAAVILTRKDDLARAIQQTLTGVLNSGAQQHDQVLGILGKTHSSLAALTEINARCSSAVASIAEVSDEVSRNIGEVVMSMQTHDIVRQQIEHVDQTLTELKDRFAAGSAGADEAALICELQSAQLRHAAGELDGAVQAIIGNLKEVACKQAGLSRETRGMAGIADQTGGSFFTEMQKDISVVTVALLDSSKVNRSLCTAMGAVSDTVGEIASFVGDIEKIGEEIKLIALNAQIKSAYTGDEGAALGVLAEAIQRLSIDAIDHTTVVSRTLQAIIAVTQGLNSGVCTETSTLEDEVHGMVGGLNSLLDVLRGVNEALLHSLSRMDDAVTRLSTEIDQVTTGITVHRKVSQVLEGVVRGLDGIGAEARRIAPEAGRGANLEELASRYTMHSERKIHQSLSYAASASAVAAVAAADEDGMGDNVELF